MRFVPAVAAAASAVTLSLSFGDLEVTVVIVMIAEAAALDKFIREENTFHFQASSTMQRIANFFFISHSLSSPILHPLLLLLLLPGPGMPWPEGGM